MNILAVSHEYPPIGGGGANAAYNLLNGFAERGHKVTLVTTAYAGRDGINKSEGIEIIEVPAKRSKPDSSSFAEMLDYLIKGYKKSKELVKNAKLSGETYDIVIAFFGIPSGPIGYMLKKKYRIPYIIRFGGGDIPGAQKRFDTVYKILRPAIRTIWRNSEARITNSEGLKQRASDYYKECKYEIIPNGVDTSRFYPGDKSDDKDTLNILFVSRLIEGKGLQYVIPRLKNIANNTDKKIKLTVVGDGPYRDNLVQLAAEHDVTDIIDFKGKKQGEELASLYREGDIFILPSEREGMPNVVLEAMASGLPVVMTPVQGSKELIDGNGFISDTNSFNDRVSELISDENLRKTMGQKSRERAVNLFSWDKAVDSYLNIMESVIR